MHSYYILVNLELKNYLLFLTRKILLNILDSERILCSFPSVLILICDLKHRYFLF